jgi:hypothetical protein
MGASKEAQQIAPQTVLLTPEALTMQRSKR